MNIVFIFIGLFLILIGLIIYKLKIIEIIFGYYSEKINNREGLARWVGRNLMLMGMLVIFLEAVEIIFPKIEKDFIIISYVIILIGISIITKIGTYIYEKRKNGQDKNEVKK